MEAVTAEGAVEQGAGSGDRGLHLGKGEGGLVCFLGVPELDDEDGVGVMVVYPDLVGLASSAGEALVVLGEEGDEFVAFSGCRP